MKLELKHIAPYLPYRLNIITGIVRVNLTAVALDSTHVFTTTSLGSRERQMKQINEIKPILRPLSDLTKEIEHNGLKFVPSIILKECYGHSVQIAESKYLITPIQLESYTLVSQLFEWHFDIFGLIEKGLAIDFNTI